MMTHDDLPLRLTHHRGKNTRSGEGKINVASIPASQDQTEWIVCVITLLTVFPRAQAHARAHARSLQQAWTERGHALTRSCMTTN